MWYKKRFLRLIPLYWLTNTAILIHMGMTPTYFSGTHGVTIFTYITNYLFLHGFYPWHINAISNNWYIGTLAIFIFIAPVCFKVVNSIWKYYWESSSIFKQLPVLSIGIILYFILFQYKAHLILKNFFIQKFGKCGAKIIFYLVFGFSVVLVMGEVLSYANMYVFSVTFALIIILLFCFPTRIVSNKVYSFIGRYSYGIYLFHPLLLNRVQVFISRYTENALYNIILSAFITLVICLAASVILTNYFEKPIRERKKSL